MACDRAGALLVRVAGQRRGAVVVEVLDLRRVLEGGPGARAVHHGGPTAGQVLSEPALVVVRTQRIPTFVFGEERVYKIRTHLVLCSSPRSQSGFQVCVVGFFVADLITHRDQGGWGDGRQCRSTAGVGDRRCGVSPHSHNRRAAAGC